ncbi:MAG: DUF1295 domain-containing protein [Chlorobi bacterium]|nr:DUF1295 domain-containing protein [Chlorobiota bacterium]
MNLNLFTAITWGWLILAVILFPVLLKIRAPYGRHTRTGWGPLIPNRLSWVLMEIPSLLVFAGFYLSGKYSHDTATWILFALWCIHYVHRSLIYPLRTRTKGKKMPLVILVFAVIFNLVNGYLNGYYLGYIRPVFPEPRIPDIRFISGFVLFAAGFLINGWADNKLIRLRNRSGNGYKIPYGGLFNRISCPNYFGEMIEWGGFALMAWNLPALSFAVWTFANLLPRAESNHQWYRENFEDYPADRKAVIPGLL